MNSIRRLFGQPIKLGKRVVIIGMDGLDPRIIREKMENGDLPNFQTLANQGGFSNLATTWTPLSPVAWSSFISGSHPGTHGIFDFLHRDPEQYAPHLSIAQQESSEKNLEVGPFSFPLEPSRTDKGRSGPSFWTESSRAGVQTNIIRCPVSFPPEPVRGKMLSGLGVPDLKGTQGEFTFFTTSKDVDRSSRGGTVTSLEHPARKPVTVNLKGPNNPFYKEARPSTVPLEFALDDDRLQIRSGEETIQLTEEEWSPWIPLEFDFLGPISAEGKVRFYLKSARPEFELYCSPINVSPDNPAFPISYPEGFSKQLADKIGPFHTLGLTADTGMLKERRVDEVTFLEQTQAVLREREAMLKEELSSMNDGIFNLVFDIPDRIQHMFWRFRDPDHSLYNQKQADVFGPVIDRNYERMDGILGWLLNELNDGDDLVVLSDHGFSSFRRQLDLNHWLMNEGYLTLQDGGRPADAGTLFKGINWNKTSAYAIGLSGIYINRSGREREGWVSEEKSRELINSIKQDLEALGDPKTEENPVSRVMPADEIYNGEATEDSPDLLVGYNAGYRISWESALGGMEEEILLDNENPWSGDHCLDPELIPGSFLANFSFSESQEMGLWDVMPGLFSRNGIESKETMEGSDHWL